MAQFPDVVDAWEPVANYFVDAAASTALAVPTVPAGQPAKGAVFVAILTPQSVACWIRTDGVAVTALVTGGIKMNPGDWRLIYGLKAITAVRVIRDAAGGALAVEYFYFRPNMT